MPATKQQFDAAQDALNRARADVDRLFASFTRLMSNPSTASQVPDPESVLLDLVDASRAVMALDEKLATLDETVYTSRSVQLIRAGKFQQDVFDELQSFFSQATAWDVTPEVAHFYISEYARVSDALDSFVIGVQQAMPAIRQSLVNVEAVMPGEVLHELMLELFAPIHGEPATVTLPNPFIPPIDPRIIAKILGPFINIWFPPGSGVTVSPTGGGGGGGGGTGSGTGSKQPHSENADPEDSPQNATQTASSDGTTGTTVSPPSPPTPATVTTNVDPTTSPSVVHPNPVLGTNVQPRQQRYLGTNVPLPTQPDTGPQFLGGGDGIISFGDGRLLGGDTFSPPGFGLTGGGAETPPSFGGGKNRYVPPSGGGGGPDPGYSPTPGYSKDGGSGTGGGGKGGQDSSGKQDAQGLTFDAGRRADRPDPDQSSSDDSNRTRYGSGDGSSSSGGANPDTGISGGSSDSTGAADRDRGGTSTSRNLGGYGWDPGDPSNPGGGKGSPNPDDPEGGSESPRVHKGMGGGPKHDFRNPPPLPDPPTGVSALSGPFAGWRTSGGGDDWGGNPHENPDPEDSGSGGINPAAVAANNTNPDDVKLPTIPHAGEYDSEWGGNNPHYMQYRGRAWQPFTNVAPVKKASTASPFIVRAGQLRR